VSKLRPTALFVPWKNAPGFECEQAASHLVLCLFFSAKIVFLILLDMYEPIQINNDQHKSISSDNTFLGISRSSHTSNIVRRCAFDPGEPAAACT
jgi:hypothetical protein